MTKGEESIIAIAKELDYDLIILVMKCFLNESSVDGNEERKEMIKLRQLQKKAGEL